MTNTRQQTGGIKSKAKKTKVRGDKAMGDKVMGDKIVQQAPAPIALSLYQLPAPPADFTGRQQELDGILSDLRQGAVISGIRGLGGIGKTALALKLADLIKDRYPDAQFFVNMRGASDKPLSPAEAMAHVIRAYYPTSKLPDDETELQALYRTVLHNQRALILLDDAKDAEQIRPLLPPASAKRPRSEAERGCLLLITSRQHFYLPGLHATDLNQLPPDDARDLLLKIAPRLDSVIASEAKQSPAMTEAPALHAARQPAAARNDTVLVADIIARLCGYLPLALQVAGSALAERIDLSPADYIRRLSDTQQRLKLTGVDASLQLSYDLLTPELRKLWSQLAVFPAEFDRIAATYVWFDDDEDSSKDKAQDALSELVKYSLVEYKPPTPTLPRPASSSGTGEGAAPLPSPVDAFPTGEGPGMGAEGRYHLHDLARLFAAARLSDDERYTTQQRHAEHYAKVFGDANQMLLQGSDAAMRGLALFEIERLNIQIGQKWAREHINDNEAATQACNWYGWQGSLLHLRFHPREQIQWMEAALIAARQLGNREAESAHLGNLGVAYPNLSETRQAIELYEQHLQIAREIGDRHGEGAALGNLGNAYYSLGEARQAIEYHEQALIIDREIGDKRGEANVLMNTGNAHFSLGEYRRAIEFYEQALIIFREIGDKRGEGTALGNLGIAYVNLSETRQAIKVFEQHLQIAREIGDKRGEGAALGNLGNAYYSLGEARQAIEFYEQRLQIAREIGDRRGEGNALGNLGLACADLGETRQAIEFYEQALTIRRAIGDRRGEGNDLWNMALALDKLGEQARAIAHAEAALKIYEQIEDPHAEKVRQQLAEWRGSG